VARIVLGADPDPAPLGLLARRLRDAGHEVVLTSGTDADGLAAAAVQEDADLVLVTVAADATLPAVEAALAALGAADVPAYAVDPADVPGALARAASYDGDG
jgi:methylmalonyl-CoA mutase cobalamin-binding subunit